MKPICCYCPGWKPFAPENKGASHTICAACQAKVAAQLLAGR